MRMSFSCFTNNVALVRGIVYIDQSSNATFASNSFGDSNTVQLGNCDAVYMETSGNCFETGMCEGECREFGSRTCRINLLENGDNDTNHTNLGENETLTPSAAPTPGRDDGPPSEGGSSGSDDEDDNDGFVGSIGFILLVTLLPLCCILCLVGGFCYRRRSQQIASEEEPLVPDNSVKDLLGHDDDDDDDGRDGDGDSMSSRSTDIVLGGDTDDDFDDDDNDKNDDDVNESREDRRRTNLRDDRNEDSSLDDLHRGRGLDRVDYMDEGNNNDRDDESRSLDRSIP